MSSVRKCATVRVSNPVDGTKKRRKPRKASRVLATPGYGFKVDDRVMKAARAARRPGEFIFPINETEVVIRKKGK